MHVGLRPVGIFAAFAFEKDPQLAGLNRSGVATMSESYDQLNFETLAAARPDLIVTIFDSRMTKGPLLGFL